MARRKHTPKPVVQNRVPEESGPLAHRPFQGLKGLIEIRKEEPVAPEPVKETEPEDDLSLFESAMAEVTRLPRKKIRVAGEPDPAKPGNRPIFSEEMEVLAQLEDLVAGRVQFDIVDTDEYIEGRIRGFHPLTLEKLRRGRFSVQAHLDLHGLTVREAEEAVRDFITESLNLGYRCVLLVHGRGLNSKDQIPVLKERLEKILLRGPVRRHILAFTSARPHDGGAGASYVLLRAKP